MSIDAPPEEAATGTSTRARVKRLVVDVVTVLAFFVVILVTTAIVLNIPSWHAHSKAVGCLDDRREEVLEALDGVSILDRARLVDEWNDLAALANDHSNFFVPVGGDAKVNANDLCRSARELIAEANTLSEKTPSEPRRSILA